MNFIEKILSSIQNFGDFIGEMFSGFLDILVKPLAYILAFFEGIFYFITKLFTVVVEIIMLFVALFQFLFAIITGFFRTLGTWLGFIPSSSYNIPTSETQQGLNVFFEVLGGTGFMTLLPNVLIFLVWLGFIYKVINLFGNKGSVNN